MGLIEKLKCGEIPQIIKKIALEEGISEDKLAQNIINGYCVIPANINQSNPGKRFFAIGKGVSTKINANIGTSEDYQKIEDELKKLEVSIQSGADTVMDLSTAGNLDEIRKEILVKSSIPVGTVPIYQAALEAIDKHGSIVNMNDDDLFKVIEKHAADGVDFMTVHTGVTFKALDALSKEKRICDIVSRGGAFLAGWMLHNKKENPLYGYFDRLLEIAKKYDVTLSLGDGMRPGCIADAGDEAQMSELNTIGEQIKLCRQAGVQAIVEGPGHVPLNKIEEQVRLANKATDNSPLYLLGPLVTDIAAGYDHISAAIGGAIAASVGADFLCYVTPREHLGLPTFEDVKLGVIASKIAAHAADIAKNIPAALLQDNKMSIARKSLNWEDQIKNSIDPASAKKLRKERLGSHNDDNVCSMCGEFCAMDFVDKYLGNSSSNRVRP